MIPVAVKNTPSLSSNRSTIHNPDDASIADDVESQISSTTTQDGVIVKSTHAATSPITYKSPIRTKTQHVLRGSPSFLFKRKTGALSSGILPRDLPLGTTAKAYREQREPSNTMVDRVLDSVESNSCQLRAESEIAVAMKKRVMIDERHNMRVSPTQATTTTCTTIPAANPPARKSPKSILKRSLKFEVRPNKKHHVDKTSTPLGQSHFKTNSGGPTTVLQPIQYQGDLLDYIFESVESFLCRQDKNEKGQERTNNEDNIAGTRNGPDQLHRVYKVPSTDTKHIIHTQPKDTLDYIFECGGTDNDDQELRIYSTPAKDRDLLDYMFECADDDMYETPDSRDASFRAPQSPQGHGSAMASRTPNRDSSSIILTSSSSESGSNDTNRIGRAEILRQKKRQIEEKRRSLVIRGEQRLYMVPKGYEDDTTTRTMIISQVSSDALSQAQCEKERSRTITRVLTGVLAMTVAGVVLVVISISFFFPFRK